MGVFDRGESRAEPVAVVAAAAGGRVGGVVRGGGGREGAGETRSSGDGGNLERKERALAVRDAIAALPVELREAIVLFEFEEMSQAEIAVTVGASVKAVEARVARAREKLRVTLRRWV